MPDGIVLSDDLLFTSKITGTAQALGLSMRVARTPDALLSMAEASPPGAVLIDLHHPGLDLATLLPALHVPRVIGYGSHVEAAMLHAARVAGCTLVLPRSKFVERLPHDLAEWLQG